MRELDISVAEKVMGWPVIRTETEDELQLDTFPCIVAYPDWCEWCEEDEGHVITRGWCPSESISVAWHVVERLAELGYRLNLTSPGGFTDEGLPCHPTFWTAVFRKPYPLGHQFAEMLCGQGATAQLAICEAAVAYAPNKHRMGAETAENSPF